MADDLPIDDMNETEFEEFCADLLREHGFVNVDWRKGTGLSSSPSDSGRDIVAQLLREDVGGQQYLETWFVDCKHYKKGVPPKEVNGLLAWATAERADVALIIASNFLSNPCKDYLKQYETNNRPPFRIRRWERPTLQDLIAGRDEFIQRYLRTSMRTEAEILSAEQQFFDSVWYNRSFRHGEGGEKLRERGSAEPIIEAMLAARQSVAERYGVGSPILGPHTDFEWGMINGKLSALRWMLGEDWDFLDT